MRFVQIKKLNRKNGSVGYYIRYSTNWLVYKDLTEYNIDGYPVTKIFDNFEDAWKEACQNYLYNKDPHENDTLISSMFTVEPDDAAFFVLSPIFILVILVLFL